MPQKNFSEIAVSLNLCKIAALKSIEIKKEIYAIWHEQINKDIKSGEIDNIEAGFENLLKEKSYGGLDYAIFYAGAKRRKYKSRLIEGE